MKKKDKIVESVIKQFKKRSKKGIRTYGTTLEENDRDDFLQHLKEELMDAVLYLEKVQSVDNRNFDHFNAGLVFGLDNIEAIIDTIPNDKELGETLRRVFKS